MKSYGALPRPAPCRRVGGRVALKSDSRRPMQDEKRVGTSPHGYRGSKVEVAFLSHPGIIGRNHGVRPSADSADSCSVPICRKARNQGDEHGRDQEAADYDNHGRFHLNQFGVSAVVLELWPQRCMRQASRQRVAAEAHFGA